MADLYTVVSDLVPAYEGAEPTIVQIDAPAGYFITSWYGHQDGAGSPAPHDPFELVTDGEDRVTGVVFYGQADPEPDYTGYAVCVAEAPAPSGTAALVSGTVNVPYTALTSSSRIFVEGHTPGGTTAGNVYRVTSRTPGTGFTISAVIVATGLTGILDTSTVDWQLTEP
jgi:hypothetical protein